MRLGENALHEIREALAGKKGAEAKLISLELAARLNISPGYIYRISAAVRAGKRARRKDRGEKKIELTPEIEIFMRGLTVNADFSADHVLFVTARHFGLPEDFISISTYNAWLRREQMSRALVKKDLRPYRSFEWPRANALHHYDTTVAEAFYANDDGSIGREEKRQRYKNKPGNRRPRLVLYSLIDDYSRVLFARFYFSENTLNLLDFIFNAWAQKEDRRFPFYGIPENFYCDQGAPAKSAKFQNAEAKLGFKMLDTMPSHATEFGPRKHGKVERTFGEGLLGEFMKITRIFRFASIEELNACLWDWLIHINNKKSRTTREVRFARWLRSVTIPRSMPSEEMFKLLRYDRATPTVSKNLQIQLNGKTFQLPYRKPFINWATAKIEAYWYPGHEDVVTVVYDFYEEEIKALAPVIDIGGEYKRIETTDREKTLEALKQQKYAAVNFPAIYAPSKDLPYLPRKGEAFDETRIAEKTVEGADGKQRPSFAPEIWHNSFVEAALELINEGYLKPPLKPDGEDRAWLKALIGDRERISDTELKKAARERKAKKAEAEGGGNDN